MAILRFRDNDIGETTGGSLFSTWFFDTFIPGFITQGWRVWGSGDGTTFENNGQKAVGAAFARLVTPFGVADTETFTLDDGVNTPVVFEFDNNASVVETPTLRRVDITGATDEFDVQAAIIAAVNAAGSLNISAAAGVTLLSETSSTAVVLLTNDTGGVAGNTTSSETVADVNFTLEDMHGGTVAGGLGSGGQYHVFTAATGLDTTSPWVAGNWGNIAGFGVPGPDFRGASWIRLVSPADDDQHVEYLFQLPITGGGIEGSLIIAMCSGTQRFDVAGDEWQRPSVNTGVAIRLGAKEHAETPERYAETAFLRASSGSKMHGFIGDSSVDYDFMLYFHRKNSSTPGEVYGVIGRMRTIAGGPRTDASTDPDPYVHFWMLESSNGNSVHQIQNARMISLGAMQGVVTSEKAERLEDRTFQISSGGTARMFATFNRDDPGVPASVQGHYALTFLPYSVGVNDDLAYDQGLGVPYAGVELLRDPIMKVARIYDNPSNATLHFYKGIIKNSSQFSWAMGGNRVLPRIVKDGINPQYVHWGRFMMLWDENPAGTDEITDL
jgi:hypothetical protein